MKMSNYVFFTGGPIIWADCSSYVNSKRIVQSFQVINDHAERGVALMKEYNGSLTRSEEESQFVLQVGEAHRKQYPNVKKETLKRNL